jgi:hypothetical protein
MAGAGWKSYSTGDLIDATTFQTFIQDQVIQVYNNVSARDTALGTSDAEGMFCFLKDNSAGSDGSGSSELQFYNGSAWVAFIGDGDITGVTITTAGTSGLSGGGAGTKTPALDVAVGYKYKFDISDNSNSGHPLKFSITKDGTHNSGSAFTTNVTESGTAGSANAYIEVEITPETVGTGTATGATVGKLYYYCPNHSGMGAEGNLSLYPNSSGGGAGTAFDQLLLIGA